MPIIWTIVWQKSFPFNNWGGSRSESLQKELFSNWLYDKFVLFDIGTLTFCFTFKVTKEMKGKHWQWSHWVSLYDSVLALNLCLWKSELNFRKAMWIWQDCFDYVLLWKFKRHSTYCSLTSMLSNMSKGWKTNVKLDTEMCTLPDIKNVLPVKTETDS